MTTAYGGLGISTRDRGGLIRLDRPQQRHALTIDMLETMRATLTAWADQPGIELVIIDASEDGFCGGGDLGALCKGPVPDGQLARRFWAASAALAATLARYRKPIVVLADGLTAGSGVGLIAHATYRVVTERSRLALPETTIGLVPDMALTWLLARSSGVRGTYLALSGYPLDAAGAIHVGLADGMVPADRLMELRERLLSPFGGPFERILNSFASDAGPVPPTLTAALPASAFAEPTIERMLAVLDTDSETGTPIADALRSRSPLALKLTLALMQRVQQSRTIEDALLLEYRVLTRLFELGEVQEGVRARLIDAGRAPNWSYTRLADIDPTLVASFFAPMLPGEDLVLPSPR